MYSFNRTILATSIGLLTAFGVPVAQADGASLEKVVVTAQKREQDQQDTPLSISTFDAQALEDQGISDIEDVSIYVPNVQISETPGGSTGATIGIRGSVTINPAVTWEPTVGIYMDGVFIAKNIGGLFDVAELERIEILRGPQGTLYGKNTTGGAVNLVTRRPSGEMEGKVRLGAGNFGYRESYVSVDTPSIINDKLSFSVALSKKDRDGFYDNDAGGDAASEFKALDSIAGRMSALFNATDDLQFYYTFDRSEKDNTPAFGQSTGSDDDSERQDEGSLNGAFFDKSSSVGHAFHMEWDVSDNLTIKSISAYREMTFDDANDYDGTPFTFFHSERHVDQKQWSEEIQFIGSVGSVDFVTGVFLFRENADAENPFEFQTGVVDNFYGVDTNSMAAYGQLDWHATDALTLTTGLRWTQEDKDFYVDNLFSDVEADKRWTNTSPMAAVSYAWTDNILNYAKVTQGWKSGGFNGEASSTTSAATPYDEETVIAYETGLKSRWFDSRLQANIAVFQNNIEDLQISSYQQPYSQLTNAGKATVKGVEVELLAAITDNFMLNINYGYLDAKYDEFDYYDSGTNTTIDISDIALFQYAPEKTFSIGAEYNYAFSFAEIVARMDWSYVDDFDVYPEPWNEKATHVRSYHLLNARIALVNIALGSTSQSFEVAVWGKNLTDEEYRINGIPTGAGSAVNYFGDPRTFGADVTYNF
ncbi:TonB-dependent receptor [Gammaproteobacteria bacterium 45_16_T64]|nr:TonB-dependent receptor [Gammaproteobacteria bacterium 45_16_T64]